MTSDAPDIHTLSGAYALDALDPAEATAFEGHLESCESCRDEVRSFRDAVGALADDVAAPAPDRLRSSVLSAISEVRPLPPVVPVEATTPIVGTPIDSTPRATASPAASDELATRRAAKARRAPAWLLVAAAVLAVVAAGGLWRSVSLQQQLTSVTALAADVSAVITSPDATTVSGEVAGSGRAAVVRSASTGKAVLITDGVAAAPAGMTYQAWFITSDGTATSAGLVPSGDHTAVLLSGSPSTGAVVGLTLEPAGGSSQPTTKPVVAIMV
jgi:anti-sigma-K factor RskA